MAQRSVYDLVKSLIYKLIKKHLSLFSYSMDGNLIEVKNILEVSKEDINRPGDLGYTALGMAAGRGHLEIVEVLLANGMVLILMQETTEEILLYTIRGNTII